jgi:hypothetical protein
MNWSNAIAKRSAAFVSVFVLIFVLGGCQPGNSYTAPIPPTAIPGSFSNADWATVLSAVVTPDGYVRWNEVQSNADGVRAPLMAYIGLINAVSPANHAELFASANDRLAYWINAYNAMCLYAVIEYNYPATMLAGEPPGAILSDQKFSFGGQMMSLDELVRTQLESAGDPRIFFALSFCASSGPPLRLTPYDGAVLDAELVDQGQRYLSDPRAAVRDGEAVKLNNLLTSMHAYDFLAGYKKMLGVAPTGLLQALQPYVQSDSPIVGATRVENLGFDWSLNRPPR